VGSCDFKTDDIGGAARELRAVGAKSLSRDKPADVEAADVEAADVEAADVEAFPCCLVYTRSVRFGSG
jgi:hypothetical protein